MRSLFGRAMAFGLQLPDIAMGLCMFEGAKLSEQTQQNLATLTQRSDKYRDVVDALRELGVAATQHLTRAPAGSTSGNNRTTYYQVDAGADDQESDDEYDDESSEMEFNEEVEKELDRLDLREDQVQEVFLASDKSRRPEKRTDRRTWKETQELKRQLRKERNFGSNGGNNHDEKVQEPMDGGRKGMARARARASAADCRLNN